MFNEKKIIGILGGGQLGKMVLDVSNKWGLDVFVLDPDKYCPSSKLCKEFFEGDLMDYETVVKFGKLCDIITIETENVNVEALKHLESLNKKVYPQANVIKTVQDHGNTSAASIPLALSVASRSGQIVKNDLIVTEAIGGGLAWGAIVLRW